MTNEAAKARLVELVESVQAGMQAIARMQREQVTMTESATDTRRRVTVVVNANGVVVETRLSADVEDLTPEELARAFTEAAQAAALGMARRTREMVASLNKHHQRIPRLSEFIPGIPDVQDLLPTPPEASLEAPAARKLRPYADDTAKPMQYADVEEWEHDSPGAKKSDVAESGW